MFFHPLLLATALAAAATPWPRVLLPTGNGAVALDGSPAALYLRPGVGALHPDLSIALVNAWVPGLTSSNAGLRETCARGVTSVLREAISDVVVAEDRHDIAGRGHVLRACLQVIEAHGRHALGDVLAHAFDDVVQHGHSPRLTLHECVTAAG